jgi:hypothetical protein
LCLPITPEVTPNPGTEEAAIAAGKPPLTGIRMAFQEPLIEFI